MKQKMLWVVLAMLPLAAAGCGDSDAVSIPEDVQTISSDSDYGEVTLCDYKNLSEEKAVYEITDAEIDSEIENLLYEHVEYEAQERPSQTGDYINVYITGVSGDTTVIDFGEESFDIELGSAVFGPEFDEKLTGVLAGDKLSFSITYADDYEDEFLAGMTVDYDITVREITQEAIPELTEEFIVDTLGYASEEDMREQIAASLKSQYESESEYELREKLIQQVIDGSSVESYSQELYDSCAASVEEGYAGYAEMFGCENVEEIYELFEMTEEDVEQEVLNQLYRLVIVNEICERENLTLSDEEYHAGLERYAEDYEYDSIDEMLADYEEASLYSWILEDKVLDLLEENATITETIVETGEEEFVIE